MASKQMKSKGCVKSNKNQQEIIVNFMLEHPELLHKKFDKRIPWGSREKLWLELTALLNQAGNAKKTACKWRKSWVDYKSMLKAKVNRIKRESEKPGGGKPEELTELELKALPLISLDKGTSSDTATGPDTTTGPESQRKATDSKHFQKAIFNSYSDPSTSQEPQDIKNLDLQALTSILISDPSRPSPTLSSDIPSSCDVPSSCNDSSSCDDPQSRDLSPSSTSKRKQDQADIYAARLNSINPNFPNKTNLFPRPPKRRRETRGVTLNSDNCSSLIAAHLAMAEGLNNIAKAIQANTTQRATNATQMANFEERKMQLLERLVTWFRE